MEDDLIEKFHRYFTPGKKTECWNWTGWIGSKGYAQISHKGKFYTASRIAYELHYLKKPGKKLILHKCDNPKCVNPYHLFIGTQKDNMRDMKTKNRQVFNYTPVKLNENKVKKIHTYLAFGMTQIMIAKEFDIHRTTVSKIKNGHSWKGVAVDLVEAARIELALPVRH